MQLIKRDSKLDMEVWAHYDHGADVWEMFASNDGEDYLGCADNLADCLEFARDRFNQEYLDIGNRY